MTRPKPGEKDEARPIMGEAEFSLALTEFADDPGDKNRAALVRHDDRLRQQVAAIRASRDLMRDKLKAAYDKATRAPWRDKGHTCESRQALQAVTDCLRAALSADEESKT